MREYSKLKFEISLWNVWKESEILKTKIFEYWKLKIEMSKTWKPKTKMFEYWILKIENENVLILKIKN
jgi:hypothetical protein